MKKIFIIISIIIIFLLAFAIFCKTFLQNTYKHNVQPSAPQNSTTTINQVSATSKMPVSYNGWLHTEGSNIKNEKGEIIQLRGLSSHGIEWFSDVITYDNLAHLKNDWKINVFRIAMYTDSDNFGYVHNPDKNTQQVYDIIDMAIRT